MPLELLAIGLLRHIGKDGTWVNNRNAIVGGYGILLALGPEYGRREVIEAVNEAWEWLYINGFTVSVPGEYAVRPEEREGVRHLSRKGKALLESDDPMNLFRAERMIANPLHPRIEAKARVQFAIGEYESAVLMAFRELEIRVRMAGGFPSNLVGPPLMREAFTPDKPGPLVDQSLNNGEQKAVADLFAGAMGAFKNPLSHRTVDYGDPIIAAEQLLFADLLQHARWLRGKGLEIFISASIEPMRCLCGIGAYAPPGRDHPRRAGARPLGAAADGYRTPPCILPLGAAHTRGDRVGGRDAESGYVRGSARAGACVRCRSRVRAAAHRAGAGDERHRGAVAVPRDHGLVHATDRPGQLRPRVVRPVGRLGPSGIQPRIRRAGCGRSGRGLLDVGDS